MNTLEKIGKKAGYIVSILVAITILGGAAISYDKRKADTTYVVMLEQNVEVLRAEFDCSQLRAERTELRREKNNLQSYCGMNCETGDSEDKRKLMELKDDLSDINEKMLKNGCIKEKE